MYPPELSTPLVKVHAEGNRLGRKTILMRKKLLEFQDKTSLLHELKVFIKIHTELPQANEKKPKYHII